MVCFQQASVSLGLVLTLPPIPTRLMNFSPLLSLFNLCLQVVHQALLHLGNQRITGTARVPRNGGTQERSIFVGIHGGGPPRSPSPHWNSESCGQQSRWRAKASEWRNMEMLFCSGRFFLCLNFSDFWSDTGCLRNYSVLIFATYEWSRTVELRLRQKSFRHGLVLQIKKSATRRVFGRGYERRLCYVGNLMPWRLRTWRTSSPSSTLPMLH